MLAVACSFQKSPTRGENSELAILQMEMEEASSHDALALGEVCTRCPGKSPCLFSVKEGYTPTGLGVQVSEPFIQMHLSHVVWSQSLSGPWF